MKVVQGPLSAKARAWRGRRFTGMIVAACAAFLLAVSAASAQVVTVAIGSDISTGDPHKISGGGEYMFFSNTFEGLYGHDLEGKLTPLLATAYKVSPDGLVYEFALRKGVTFHNGDPFTAADVRFSWQRAANPEIKNPRANIVATNIKDVEIVDESTVKIHLKKPDSSMLENLGEYLYIVPKGHIEKVGDDAFAKAPVGTGPYKFVERQVKQLIKLEANKQHWGYPPAVGGVTIRIVQDELTRVAMLKTGEADIIVDVPPHLTKEIDGDPNLKMVIVPSYQNIFISITNHRAGGTLADKKVRQAFNHAIDKKTIIEKVMFGHARQEAAPCQKGIIGCDIGREPYAYDEKRAKQLLQEAKFNFDKTYRFVSMGPGRTPKSKEVAEAIVHYLGRVGVKVKLDIMEYGAWLAFVLARKYDEADLVFWTWTDYNNDPMGRLPRSIRTDGSYAWVSYPTLDPLIDEANGIVDPKAREEHLRKIFTEIYDDPPFIFLWSVDMLYAARKNIEWQPAPNVSWPVFWKLSKK